MKNKLPIVVIEDDPIIARALIRALQINEQPHLLITNYTDALQLRGDYAGAIIDLHLPDGNGLTLYSELLKKGLSLPTVFFSATTIQAEIDEAKRLGVYVPKSHGVVHAVDLLLRLVDEFAPPESETRTSTPRLPIAEVKPVDFGSKNAK